MLMLSGSGGKIKSLSEAMGVQIAMFCLQRTRQQVRPRRDVRRHLGLNLTRSSPQLEGLLMDASLGIGTLARMGVDPTSLEVVVLIYIKCKKS